MVRLVVVALGEGPPCPVDRWVGVDHWVRLGPAAVGEDRRVRCGSDWATGWYTVLACPYWTHVIWWPPGLPWPAVPPEAVERTRAWDVYQSHVPPVDAATWLSWWPSSGTKRI